MTVDKRPNSIRHFFMLRKISHRQRMVLAERLAEYFRFVQEPAWPSKSEIKYFAAGFLTASAAAIIIMRGVMFH